MVLISEALDGYLIDYGISLDSDRLQQFDTYADLLLEWNKKINLTAITDPQEIAVKHFLDSLLLFKVMELPQGSSFIDIGTGAGFPSVPLKIARPDLKLTLLDSLNKRIGFLSELSRVLNQDNSLIHGRAEHFGRDEEFREKFDFAVARGLANLPALCEYCIPFVRPGGIFAALKGPGVENEIKNSETAIHTLGSEIIDIKTFNLPLDNKRSIVIIKKISRISHKYPRISSKISKDPL